MFEEIWEGILEFSAQFVMPDWAGLIGLIPLGLAAAIVLWLIWVVIRHATAGPTRRGKRRIKPVAPSHLHMPGPSLSPLLGAVGTFLLFAGLVFGGPILWVGLASLVVGLLYWGREALNEYEHVEPIRETLPAVVKPTPPGIHLPGPSFRPLLASLSTGALFLGLVYGGWVLVVAVVFLVVTLLGWLHDAKGEYRKTEEADRIGHLENLPAPGYPTKLLAVFAALVLLAASIDLGILPPRSEAAEPTGAPGPGPTAGPTEPGPEADVVIHAVGIEFVEKTFTASSGGFTLALVNEDAGVPHNVEIREADGSSIWMGDLFNGVETRIYDVPPIPAGTYTFICTAHPVPAMTGTVTLVD